VYPVDRTHRLARDLYWVPPRVRAAGWLVSGAIWGGVGAGMGALALLAPAGLGAWWKALVLGGAGGAVLGERAGQAACQRHIRRLARGDVPLANLRHREDGELVHVRGRLRADTTLPGLLHGRPGVFRRVVWSANGVRWVHEAGVDFSLVDERGERVFVRVSGGHMLATAGELVDYPVERFRADGAPAAVAEIARHLPGPVPAWERVLADGTEVVVVGEKTVTPDAAGDAGDYRTPPTRATLRSARVLPLLITPID
jgi:hypothetical protein